MKSEIDLIIPSWNGRRLLEECLRSVASQSRRPETILVVDNGSTDGTAEYLRSEWPAVRLLSLSRNAGFAGAVQAGIEASTAPLVALLNNDARPEPEWLVSLEKAFAWPQVGACASLILTPEPRVESGGIGFSHFGVGFRLFEGSSPDTMPSGFSEVFGASGGAVMYRRRALLQAHGFDITFFAQDEDIDLAFRLRYAGYTCLLNPDARVIHLGGRTLRREPNLLLSLAQRNLEWAFWLNFPPWTWPIWGTVHTGYQALSLLRHLLKGNGLIVAKAKAEALSTLPAQLRRRRVPTGFTSAVLPWLGRSSRVWALPRDESQ